MPTDLLSLDAAGLLAASTAAERDARLAEVHKLEVLSVWAALHSTDPTEGPDGRAARRIGDVLLGLEQQLVLVTHDLDLAARCDRVLVVDDGRVVADGGPDEAIVHYTDLVDA